MHPILPLLDIKSSVPLCKCNGKCTGYGTSGQCPPLIVVAVLAATQQQTAGFAKVGR